VLLLRPNYMGCAVLKAPPGYMAEYKHTVHKKEYACELHDPPITLNRYSSSTLG
jgi:hypothetical protein